MQWECYVCYHFLSIGFLAYTSGRAITWADDRRDHFSMRGITLQLPALLFSACAILGRMIAQNLTGSIHHPGRQLADRAGNFTGNAAFSAIVGWLLRAIAHYPKYLVPGALSWRRGGNGRHGAKMAAQIFASGGVYAISASVYCRGAAVLVTRMMLGDNAGSG